MCSYVKCPVMLMKNIWNKDKFPGFEDVLARVITDVATKRTILLLKHNMHHFRIFQDFENRISQLT